MEILTQTQKRLLDTFAAHDGIRREFYFTGGTPLAVLYLKHRYSEDLDFFSENEVDTFALAAYFGDLKKGGIIDSFELTRSFNRNLCFLKIGDEQVKAEFTYFPFPRIETGSMFMGLSADSAIDIAVNKLFSIYSRTAARDYIDLYLLCRELGFTLDDLKRKARIKFDWNIDPIQLGAQFLRANEAEDLPRLLIPLETQEWRDFFTHAAEDLKSDVFE